ncbi:uncharacterized protein LOC142328196 isoform X3 [Lycorma delicatula]|uniref:uncharacterized protein LOC142328196 isoform X3 n=1 Tax=Lycorma delicatula TaxID=130591 RepID=UPI003F514583
MSEWTDHLEADVSPEKCVETAQIVEEPHKGSTFYYICSHNHYRHEITNKSKCFLCNIDKLPARKFITHHLQHIRDLRVSVVPLPEGIGQTVNISEFNKSIREEEKKTVNTEDKHRSPIRLVIRKLKQLKTTNSAEAIFQVYKTKNSIHLESGTMSSEVSATVPSESVQPSTALSPTPSEILKPEGFMPQSPFNCAGEDDEDERDEAGPESESPTSELDQDVEDDNEEDREEKYKDKPDNKDDGSNASDTNQPADNKTDDVTQQDVDSGVESERGGFAGFESSDPVREPTPPAPKVGSLTILAPSLLNSSVMNGTLTITQSDSSPATQNNSNSESFSVVGGLSIEPVTVPNNSSVTVTPAHNGGNNDQGSLLQGIDSTNNGDPLTLLQGFIDQPSNDNLEYMPLDHLDKGRSTCEVCGEHAPDPIALESHKSSAGHFKCHASVDCTSVLFSSKTELTNHQLSTHGIQPHSSSPAPMDQLTQQQHTPPSGSPGLQQAQIYRVPPSQSASPQPGQSPQQGTIQPRAFANMNQARMPIGPGTNSNQRSSPDNNSQQRITPTKRSAPGVSPGSSPSRQSAPGAKQRRMDILLPDRHDDADCHVIAMQKRSDSGLQIQNVQGRDTNGFQLSDSISLTTTSGRPSSGPQIGVQKKGNDANAVANILATRGITVTPAGGNRLQQQQPQQPQPPQQPMAPGRRHDNAIPAPVTTLNLNSAISIIPTNQGRQNPQSGFAVPQGRIRNQPSQQMVERPPRPPTVDLTQDTPTTHRGRPPGRLNRHTCQVCDKVFATSDALATHMVSHRSPAKLPFRCNLCNAQYPTQQGLTQHKQTFHKENAGSEMALPVVDLKQPGLMNRLASLGIRHFIPLSQLQSQTGGVFGLPIVAIDNARNPAVCNLGTVGASNVLSLGPMKAIGPR